MTTKTESAVSVVTILNRINNYWKTDNNCPFLAIYIPEGQNFHTNQIFLSRKRFHKLQNRTTKENK